MKSKILTLILSATLIACLGVSIYQLNTASALKNRLLVLTNTKNELTVEIENKTEELKNITSETEEMNNTISELTAKLDNLKMLANDMQSEIKSLEEAQSIEVNSTHTDVILGEDEYKGDEEVNLKESATETVSEEDLDAIADQIYQDLLKEHPEWVADENTTQQGNYEHVGTPDSGQFTNPNYTVGESGGEGISDGLTVY